jgi:CDI immunity proteins
MLDTEKGIPESPPVTADEYPLPAWYRAVRDIPLRELSVEDLSKANRQQIHPDHIVPTMLELLQTNPLAGEMYDGSFLFLSNLSHQNIGPVT